MKSFILKPRPPFHLELTVWTLRRRPENAVDAWDGSVYRRVLLLGEKPALIEVSQLGGGDAPRLAVQVHGDHLQTRLKAAVTAAVERLLGIRVDMQPWYDFAKGKANIGPLARRFRGMKPPRYLTGFECLANAVACQQISLAAGMHLLNRFAESFGQPIEAGSIRRFAFPRPEDVVHADKGDLRTLGFSGQKALALINLARMFSSGELDLARMEPLGDEDAVAELCRLRGVGRWTAEYVLLRGMGRLQVFPGAAVGARNSLAGWLDTSEELDYEGVARRLDRWKPFAGLIYFHLLLDKLDSKGRLEPDCRGQASNRNRSP